MEAVTMTSDQARREWREMLDHAYMDNQEVVIERYGKPIVAVVKYTQWQKTQDRLEELELILGVRTAKAREAAGETTPISHDDLKRLLIERRNQGTGTNVGT